jgi:hypothetical protein
MRIINEFLAGKIKPDTVLLVELFVVLSMVLYWPVVSFQYIYYDDPGWIFGNPIVMVPVNQPLIHTGMPVFWSPAGGKPSCQLSSSPCKCPAFVPFHVAAYR